MEAEYRAAAAAARRFTMACDECLKDQRGLANVGMNAGVREGLLNSADEVLCRRGFVGGASCRS